MRGQVVAVEGPSAAGKSRAVTGASPSLGAAPLAEGYARLRPTPSLRWRTPGQLLKLERTLLREEGRRYREAQELATVGSLVLADTGFLGPLTYTRALVDLGLASPKVLSALVEDAHRLASDDEWGLPEAFLYLLTPARERSRRAAHDPRGHPAAFQSRHAEVGEFEEMFYRDAVAPEFGGRFRFVSGAGSPSVVAQRVARTALQVGRTRPAAPSLGRILEAVAAVGGVP